MSDTDGFEYQGHLLFNGIYQTELRDSSFRARNLFGELPKYEPGTPDNPGRGFVPTNLKQEANKYEIVEKDSLKILDDVSAYKYVYENYTAQEVVDVDGSTETAFVKEVNDVGVYWFYPNQLFIRGNKSNVEAAIADIRGAVSGQIRVFEQNFDHDFLFWLMYKYHQNKTITGNLSIVNLTDAELAGNEMDTYGDYGEVHESTDISQSATVLLALLRNKKLKSITGNFEVLDNIINAELSTSGRIHVKTKGDIAESNDLLRIIMALSFLRAISSMYKDWSQMPPKEKFPPMEFFEEMYEICINQGVRPSFALDNVINEYLAKRNESVDDISLTFD